MNRWPKKRKPPPAEPEAACECGNHPLTKEDIAAGGKCLCCRTKHLFYHDDQYCRRCGCPLILAFPKEGNHAANA